MYTPIVFAHRGVSELLPENTIPALESAMDLACLGIEFDVHLTKDNIPVIIHDETINRTSNGKGFVCEHTLKSLKSYDFGTRISPKNIQIPTLHEVLTLIIQKNYKGLLNIELKNDIIPYDGIEKIVLSMVERFGLQNQVLFSSFNHKCIEKLRSLSPSIALSLLYNEDQPIIIKDLLSLRAVSANIHLNDASLTLLQELREQRMKCFVYTANDKKDLLNLFQLEVDGFFTDNPMFALKVYVDWKKKLSTSIVNNF